LASNTITNNYISDLRSDSSTNTDGVRGMSFLGATLTTRTNVYYNTVYLRATAPLNSSTFGTSGIFHTVSATATTNDLILRNNLIINESTPVGTGLTVALRRSGVANNNYGNALVSDFNVFFAGTPGTNRLLYSNGTNNIQTITDLRTNLGGGKEANSIAALPQFVNNSTTPFDLHLRANLNCAIDGKGSNASITIADDFDGDARSATTTDIGADEFVGVANSAPSITTQPSTSTQTLCQNATATANG
jgi:hypothetical protein